VVQQKLADQRLQRANVSIRPGIAEPNKLSSEWGVNSQGIDRPSVFYLSALAKHLHSQAVFWAAKSWCISGSELISQS